MSDRLNDVVVSVSKLQDLVSELREIAARNEVTLERNTNDIAGHIKRTDDLQNVVERHTSIFRALAIIGGLVTFAGGAVGLAAGIRALFS